MGIEADNPRLDRAARALVRPYFRLVHRIRWHGVENVPATGPAIVAANHQSFLDPVLVSAPLRRRLTFLAWDYYYGKRLLGPLMRMWGTVPVDLDRPTASSVSRMLRVLEGGGLCGIFPEAGRTPDGLLCRPMPGTAALALRVGAPVIPVTIHGAFAAWPPGRALPAPMPVQVYFGQPLRPEASGRTPRERRTALIYALMFRIAEGFERLGRPDLAEANRRRLTELRGG